MRAYVRRVVVLFMVFAVSVNAHGESAGYYPEALNGLSGKDLLEALRVVIRSRRNMMPQFDESMLWEWMENADRRGNGTVWDMFSPSEVSYPGGGRVPAGMTYCYIACPEWSGCGYDCDIALDLHNLFPCDAEVARLKGSLVPWTVVAADYDNGMLKIGSGDLAGTKIGAYEPGDNYKGDVARVVLYVAACYGGEFAWQDQSWNLFSDGSFPVLNDISASLMLSWHKLDPVDEKEKERNEAIYEAQHNRNPFVDMPEIADYIWGSLSGESFHFGGSGTVGEDYLKASYGIDERVWLRSRFVPDDATWSVGGEVVPGLYIEASELGVGLHELRFSSATSHGKVIIEVKE